jgi:hypothetical protein
MRVRSKGVLSADAPSLDHERYPNRDRNDLAIDREYVVLGLSFINGDVVADLAADGDHILPVSLRDLEIVNPRPSLLWEATFSDDGIFRLWPQSFYKPFYHSDLADGDAEVLSDFATVCELLYREDRATSRKEG